MPMLTPAQCRAARAWLRITQLEMADRSLVSAPTLINFERGRSVPGDEILKSMAVVFKKAGVSLVFDAAGKATGIKGTDEG